MLGFAGAVDPALESGDLVIPAHFYSPYTDALLSPEPKMRRVALAAAEATGRPAAQLDSLTVGHLVSTPGEKAHLHRRYPVGIVNMEDYWVAEAAMAAGADFISARVVLDTAGQALPGYLSGLAGSRAKAAASMAVMPWRIPAMLGLARRLPRAQEALTAFALCFLDQLLDPATAPSLVALGSRDDVHE